MWWSRRALVLTLAGLVLAGLPGCGFRPLYGTTDGVALSETLSQVEIGPIKDRLGQQVRNALLDRVSPSGHRGALLYRLDTLVSESISSLAFEKSADATRADLQLYASYSLADVKTGAVIMNNSSQAIASFNILNSEFATLMAENGARNRAVQQLAEDIRLKVAVFLKNRHSAK